MHHRFEYNTAASHGVRETLSFHQHLGNIMIHERTNSTGGLRPAVLLSAILLGAAPAFAQDFQFDGSMSRPVLENYLDRSK